MEGVECLSALDCVRLSDLDTQINYLGCPLTCDNSIGLKIVDMPRFVIRFQSSMMNGAIVYPGTIGS